MSLPLQLRLVPADGSYVKVLPPEDKKKTFTDTVVLSPEDIVENSEASATKAVLLTYKTKQTSLFTNR